MLTLRGFGLTSLYGVRRGFVPPQSKTLRAISTATGIDLNHPKILKDRIPNH